MGVLADVDAVSLTGDELAASALAGEELLNAAHALSAVLLDEFERRGAWVGDGTLSGAGWVAARTGTSLRQLRSRARADTGLRRLPAAAAARAGRLTPTHLTALADCARRHPDLAARDQTMLAAQAEILDADAFGALTRHWTDRAAAVEAPDPAETTTAEEADEVHLSRTFEGRYRLDGTFSPRTGALVAAALDGEVDRHLRAARDGDPSVPPVASQVRAAALVDLAAQNLRREPSDASVPDRYRVAVIVSADSAGAPPLAACDSPAYRVVLGAGGEVLDVGRLTPAWRRAFAGPSPSATRVASSPAATGPRRGATSTTADPGAKAGGPGSTTAPCSAAATTRSSTDASGRSTSKQADR